MRVPLSGHAYGSETAFHNRTARVSSTHTAAIDDPHTARGDLPHPPCVTPRTHARRVRSHGPRPGPRVPPSHYRLGVTRMQIYAPLRTPSTPHRCTPHARHSTTRPSPPDAHACEPERRKTHRSPSTPQPTPLAPYLVALIKHTRPSSPPLSTKLPPSSLTVRPAPRTRRVVPLLAWGRRPPRSYTGAGPDRMPIKMCRSREPATTAGPERARISAPAPHGGAGQPGPP